MKNKFFVIVATVFCTLFLWILYLNFFESNRVDYHFFNRNFSNNTVLVFDKLTDKISNFDFIDNIPSNDSIIELEKKVFNADTIECKLYFTDLDFKRKIIRNTRIPKNCNILFYKKDRVYFTKEFNFFSCNICNNKIEKYPLTNLKIANVKFLNNSKEEMLVFGELKEGNKFLTGFFKVSLLNLTIQPIKILETNNKNQYLANTLKYVGEFTYSPSDTILSYACDKYSRIYFFDKTGNYIKELITSENVPLPTISTNEKGDSFYSRGGTWNTNMVSFMKNGFVYVFSAREIDKLNLILDKYSFTDLKYIETYKIKCDSYNSRDITNLFINENGIVLSFTQNYASFKFSR